MTFWTLFLPDRIWYIPSGFTKHLGTISVIALPEVYTNLLSVYLTLDSYLSLYLQCLKLWQAKKCWINNTELYCHLGISQRISYFSNCIISITHTLKSKSTYYHVIGKSTNKEIIFVLLRKFMLWLLFKMF